MKDVDLTPNDRPDPKRPTPNDPSFQLPIALSESKGRWTLTVTDVATQTTTKTTFSVR